MHWYLKIFCRWYMIINKHKCFFHINRFEFAIINTFSQLLEVSHFDAICYQKLFSHKHESCHTHLKKSCIQIFIHVVKSTLNLFCIRIHFGALSTSDYVTPRVIELAFCGCFKIQHTLECKFPHGHVLHFPLRFHLQNTCATAEHFHLMRCQMARLT